MSAQTCEYKVVGLEGASDLEAALDRMAVQGCRLASTYQSNGHTTRLIFERPFSQT